MSGYAFSNILTAFSMPGIHAQTVSLVGFLSSAAMSTFFVDPPPRPAPRRRRRTRRGAATPRQSTREQHQARQREPAVP